MGLDTTHDCWSGPYSSFNSWRKNVAKAVGINLKEMVGFGGVIPWDETQSDPLHILLNHSDCDGSISWEQCDAIADRLEQVVPLLPADEGLPHGDREIAKRFIAGLRDAAERKENVEFQ
jgi:hypothetical protein